MTWAKISLTVLAASAAAILADGTALAAEGGNGKSSAARGRLAPNRWVKLCDGDMGFDGRIFGVRGPALLYVPGMKRFLVALGSQNRHDGPPTTYSELTLSLEERAWVNWFPKGKNWGPRIGPAEGVPPEKKHGSYMIKGKDGLLRPHLRGGGMHVWHQYCWDSDRSRAIFYAWCGPRVSYAFDGQPMKLLEYDPAERTWRQLAPKNSPIANDLPGLEFKGWPPHWMWGSLCYDPVNKEVLLFGGASVISERGDPGTWAYSIAGNEWKKVARGSARMKALRQEAEALRKKAHAAVAACRNRYYRTELPENAAKKLSAALADVLTGKDITALAARAKAAGAKGYEQTQIERAAPALAAALAAYEKLLGSVDAGVDPAKILAAEEVEDKLRRAAIALASQPPPRCYSPMVFDPKSKKILLFGGNALDRNLADTWAYDTATRSWEEHRPALSPSPRHGHGFLYLPKAGKVVLVGGWQARLEEHHPLVPEAWAYDAAAQKWGLLRRWEDAKLTEESGPFSRLKFHGPTDNARNMAVDENDVVVLQGRKSTWACRLVPERVDAAATAKHGVPPSTERLLAAPGEEFSPEWYDSAPPPDPAAMEAVLKNLPVNEWVKAPDGGKKRPNWAYSSITLDTDRDEILVWAGGHSTTHGTEITRYSLVTGRWHIDYPPQMAMCYNRRLWGLGYAYGFRPWMPRHPWHGYGYDPHIKKTLLFKDTDPVTLVFNSDAGDFDRPIVQPFAGEAPEGINCLTPKGLVVWMGHNSRAGMEKGFFLFDARKMAWQKFPVKNERLLLPRRLEYDSRRNQIIMISSNGNVYLYSMADGEVKALPADNKKVLSKGIHSYSFCEFRYVPSANMLVDMMGYAYDLEAKRWVKLKLDTTVLTTGYRLKGEPLPAGSTIKALVYDPKRDLLWTVDGSRKNGGVCVMKLDARKAQQ